MTGKFKAFRIHSENGKIAARFEEITLADLAAGEVVIRVSHSDINYKDALAATGAGRILRRFPLVGGIDLAGVVESSADERYQAGDAVLVTGCSLSETHDGGYAQFARVPGDWVIPMPPGLDALTAMSLGTAGFTAALAIHRMEQNGQTPQGGPIAVSGATGGVGSIAVDMLSGRGNKVVAISGKSTAAEYLKALGATEVLMREGLDYGSKPLETPRFAGAIDSLGGEMLTWFTRTVDYRPGRRTRPQDHRHAIHLKRRGAPRHQLLRDAPRVAAGGVAAHCHRLKAQAPRPDRHPHHRLR